MNYRVDLEPGVNQREGYRPKWTGPLANSMTVLNEREVENTAL